jgi:hypothetical protein
MYLLLWLPPVQRKVVDVALTEVMRRTHGRLAVGEVSFRPFNRLQLKEVYAEDLQGDTLLYAGRLAAGFDWLSLLEGRLLIRSVDVENFVMHVAKDSAAAEYNFQFLVDAFASTSTDTTAMDFRIRALRLKKGRATYTVRSEAALADSLLDVNHISLSQIYSELALGQEAGGALDVHLHSLSFVEKSGLEVKQLQARFHAEGGSYRVSEAMLRLPHSQLSATGEYAAAGDYGVRWSSAGVHLPDLKMLAPTLAFFPEKLTLAGEAGGRLPRVALSRFRVDYGKAVHVALEASMADYRRWQESPVMFRIKPSTVDAGWVMQRWRRITGDDGPDFPSLPEEIFTFDGHAEGSLPHLTMHLTADSEAGHLLLEGDGGYDVRTKEAHFDASLRGDDLLMNVWLKNPLLGRADAQIAAKGTIGVSGRIAMEADARMARFEYNQYTYNDIHADAVYRDDSIRLAVACADAQVPFTLTAEADVGRTTPGLTLDARLERTYLDTLHLLPGYRNAFLAGRLRAAIRGFDPEAMQAEVEMDSLSLTTERGAFFEPHLRLFYASGDGEKQATIQSRIVHAQARGAFTYAGLRESVATHFPIFFPPRKIRKGKHEPAPESLDFRVGMNHVSTLSNLFEWPRQLPDSALIMGKYSSDGQQMRLSASAYTRFMETDTLQLSVSLTGRENGLAAVFNVDNKSTNYDIDGSIEADVALAPKPGGFPDMDIRFNPTVWVLNETLFDFHPAHMTIREGRYVLDNLLLSLSDNADEYLRIDGVASASAADSLTMEVSQFRLATLFGAVKAELPLTGTLNSRMTAQNLLSSPSARVEELVFRELMFDDHLIGDLQLTGDWNRTCEGLSLEAAWGRPGQPASVVQATVLPATDSLWVQATVRDIELQWFQRRMAENLYGLSGSLGADVRIFGKMSDPQASGVVYADSARVGIRMLNTLYTMNDSIFLRPNVVEMNHFTIRDENRNTLTAQGQITHNHFSGFTPNINLTLNDFLVLNNERQTDSLFYGNLRVNGLLTVRRSDGDWLIAGDITHSDHARLTVNLPSSASTAERYDRMITYLPAAPTEEVSSAQPSRPGKEAADETFNLPLKINASLWFDPSLTIGAIFNPATGDAAYANGNGRIRFAYDLKTANLSLLGDYEIVSGNAGISLAHIARKTFAIEEGGKLVFHGDPMATTFNLTAHYNLRADLRSLDPSFGNLGIVHTKVPVSCSLTAVGSIDRMTLEYDILLPSESNDLQRKVDGLLYTDDMKIKQIAYLIALGSFMPAAADSPDLNSPNLVHSLTALTSGGLNKLLSNVLSDKWSIGTDVNGLEDISINVSGTLLNDRLTVNGQVGYHSNTGLTNNFTGDFDVEYQLVPSGNLVLKAYNATNNQYYEQAPTTQGVGIAYKREARTFRQLFDKFRKKKTK